ncbi:hypothetical protein [Spirillospora sp. NPDC047279]|uniref:hypothetical protein n=1 Tax=Spirillospora sp. NPDC047279 TaxID=3155478 RepID=UPI0033E75EDA
MADSVAEPDLPDAPENVDLNGMPVDDLEIPRVLPQMIEDVDAPDVPPEFGLRHDDLAEDGHAAEPWWMAAPDVVVDPAHSSGPLPVQAPPPRPEDRVPGPATSGGWQIIPDGPVPDSLTSGGWQVVPDGPLRVPGPRLPAPYLPRQRGRGGLLIGSVLSAGICLLALLAAGVLYASLGGDEAPASKPNRMITNAAVAGGLTWNRDQNPAVSSAYPFVRAGVRAAAADRRGNVVRVYTGTAVTPRSVLFYGGTGTFGKPAEFLAKVRPSTTIASSGVPAGKGGGQAACGTFAVLSDVHVFCAWATSASFGIVADNAAGTAAMADLMVNMRADLEKKAR